MSATNDVDRLIGDRIAVPIMEVGKWCGRGYAFVYRAIGRGDLRKFSAGLVTSDSLRRWAIEGAAPQEREPVLVSPAFERSIS